MVTLAAFNVQRCSVVKSYTFQQMVACAPACLTYVNHSKYSYLNCSHNIQVHCCFTFYALLQLLFKNIYNMCLPVKSTLLIVPLGCSSSNCSRSRSLSLSHLLLVKRVITYKPFQLSMHIKKTVEIYYFIQNFTYGTWVLGVLNNDAHN